MLIFKFYRLPNSTLDSSFEGVQFLSVSWEMKLVFKSISVESNHILRVIFLNDINKIITFKRLIYRNLWRSLEKFCDWVKWPTNEFRVNENRRNILFYVFKHIKVEFAVLTSSSFEILKLRILFFFLIYLKSGNF